MCLVFTNIIPVLVAGNLEGSVIVFVMGNQVFEKPRVLPKVSDLGDRVGAQPHPSPADVSSWASTCGHCHAPGWKGLEDRDRDEVTLQRAVGWESDDLCLNPASVASSKFMTTQGGCTDSESSARSELPACLPSSGIQRGD